MTFDEIQAIWDSQQPVGGTVERKELSKWLEARFRWFNRIIGIIEVLMILTLFFVGAMFMRDPLMQGHDLVLVIPGIVSIAAAIFVWRGRIVRKKREINFDDSIKGIVEKSLHRIKYQIRRMQSFVWWFSVPCALGLAIGLFIISEEKRYLLWGIFIPAFVICMVLAYWQIRREVRYKLLPEQKRLEELLSDLSRNEPISSSS